MRILGEHRGIRGRKPRGRGRGSSRGHSQSINRANFSVTCANGEETNGETRVKTLPLPTPGQARTISLSKNQNTDKGKDMENIKVKSFDEIMREKKQKLVSSEGAASDQPYSASSTHAESKPISSHAEPTPSSSVGSSSRPTCHVMLRTLSIPLKALPTSKHTTFRGRVAKPFPQQRNRVASFSDEEEFNETSTNNNIVNGSPIKQKHFKKEDTDSEMDEEELLMPDEDEEEDILEEYTELSENSDMLNIDFSGVPLGGSHDEDSMDEILSLHPDDSLFDEDEGDPSQASSHRLSGKFSSNRRHSSREQSDARELLNRQRVNKLAVKKEPQEASVDVGAYKSDEKVSTSEDLDDSGAHERSWQEEKNEKARSRSNNQDPSPVKDTVFKIPLHGNKARRGKNRGGVNRNQRGRGNTRANRQRGAGHDAASTFPVLNPAGLTMEDMQSKASELKAYWEQQLLNNPLVKGGILQGPISKQLFPPPPPPSDMLDLPRRNSELGILGPAPGKSHLPSLLGPDLPPFEAKTGPQREPRMRIPLRKDRGRHSDMEQGYSSQTSDYRREYERRSSKEDEGSGHSGHSSPSSSPRDGSSTDKPLKRRSTRNEQSGGKVPRKGSQTEQGPKPYPCPEGHCWSQYQVGVCNFKYCKFVHLSPKCIEEYKKTGVLPEKVSEPMQEDTGVKYQEEVKKLQEEQAMKEQQARQERYEELAKEATNALNHRNLGEACRIMETMYQMDSTAHKVFLKLLERALFLCGEYDVDADTAAQVACKVFDMIGKVRSRYTRHDFTTLIRALCRKGQYIRAYEILKLMKENNVLPTHEVFLDLIQSSVADPEWAFKLLDEIRDLRLFRTSICSALILLGSHGNTDLEKTWSLFEEMVESNVKLSKDAFLSLINCLSARNNIEKLLLVLKVYEDGSVVILPNILTAVVRYSVGKENFVETAAQVVSKRAEHGDPGLDKETWNCLLSSCCNENFNKVKHTQHIFALMKKLRIPFTPLSFSTILSSFGKANLVTQSLEVIEIMKKDPEVCRFPQACFEGIATAFALMQKVGDNDGLYMVAEFMIETGFEVNEGTLMSITTKYEENKMFEKMYVLFKKFASGKLLPPYQVMRKMFSCLEGWSSNPSAAVEVYATMRQLYPVAPENAKATEKSAEVSDVNNPKPCRYFALGKCQFGDNCRNSHGSKGTSGASQQQKSTETASSVASTTTVSKSSENNSFVLQTTQMQPGGPPHIHSGGPSQIRSRGPQQARTDEPSHIHSGGPSQNRSGGPQQARTDGHSHIHSGGPSQNRSVGPQQARTDGPSHIHSGGPSQIHPGGPQQGRNDGPSHINPGGPRQVRHDGPNQVRHDGPNQVRHDGPQQVRHDGPSQIRPGRPQQVRTDGPKHIHHEGPQQVRHDGPSQIRPGGPSYSNPGGPSQFHYDRPSQIHPEGPQQIRPGAPSHTRPGVPSQIRPGAPSQIRPEGPSQIRHGGQSYTHLGEPPVMYPGGQALSGRIPPHMPASHFGNRPPLPRQRNGARLQMPTRGSNPSLVPPSTVEGQVPISAPPVMTYPAMPHAVGAHAARSGITPSVQPSPAMANPNQPPPPGAHAHTSKGPFILRNNQGRFGRSGVQQRLGPPTDSTAVPASNSKLSPTSPFRLGPKQVGPFSTSTPIPSTNHQPRLGSFVGGTDNPGSVQHGLSRHSLDVSASVTAGFSARGTQSAPVFSASSDKGRFQFPTCSTVQFYMPRIMKAAEDGEWDELASAYVEMKDAKVPVAKEMQYLFYQAFTCCGIQGSGEAFSSFVGVLDTLLVPDGDGSGSPSDVFDAIDQRFLGNIAVAMMQVCLGSNHFQDGYYLLHSMHQYSIGYSHYSGDFLPNHQPVSPSSVALSAAQICLSLHNPSFDGALEVLRGCNYALPNLGAVLSTNEAAIRSSLIERLAGYFLSNNSAAEVVELLSNVGDKNVFGTVVLKTLYNELIRCYLRLRNVTEAVATVSKMEREFITRDSDVLRALTTCLAGAGRTTTAKELFSSSCLQGVYPPFPQGDHLWKVNIWTTFSKFETQFYLERHMQLLNTHVENQRAESQMPYDEKYFQALRITVVGELNQQVPSTPAMIQGLQESVIEILRSDFNPPLSCGMSDKPGEVIVNPRSLRRWFLANPSSERRRKGKSFLAQNEEGDVDHQRSVVASYLQPGMTIRVDASSSEQRSLGSASQSSSEVAFSQEQRKKDIKEKVKKTICGQLTRYLRDGRIASREDFRVYARRLTEEFLRSNSTEELQRDYKDVRVRICDFISRYFDDQNGGGPRRQ